VTVEIHLYHLVQDDSEPLCKTFRVFRLKRMALAILERYRRHAIRAMFPDRKGKTRCGILSA
jgi:hypothetical protein